MENIQRRKRQKQMEEEDAFSDFMKNLHAYMENSIGREMECFEAVDKFQGWKTCNVFQFSSGIECVLNVYQIPSNSSVWLAIKVLGRVFSHLMRRVDKGVATTEDGPKDEVTFEAYKWLEFASRWLHEDERQHQRYAAVLIFSEMATNVPTLFKTKALVFSEKIWNGLVDHNNLVRSQAQETLDICLDVIKNYEAQLRLQCYQKLLAATQDRLRIAESPHLDYLLAAFNKLKSHADLLLMGHTKVADIVFEHLEHPIKSVKKAMTPLLPHIFRITKDKSMGHIVSLLKRPDELDMGYIVLEKMAEVSTEALLQHMSSIISILQPRIEPPVSHKALACIGNIAKATGLLMMHNLESFLNRMVDESYADIFSPEVVGVLEQICIGIPSLLPFTKMFLLRCVIVTLGNGLSGAVCHSILKLVFQSLSSSIFKDHCFLCLASKFVTGYLCWENEIMQRDAGLTCYKILAASFFGFSSPLTNDHDLVLEILEKLITAAEANSSIHKSVISDLHGNLTFHIFVKQKAAMSDRVAVLYNQILERNCVQQVEQPVNPLRHLLGNIWNQGNFPTCWAVSLINLLEINFRLKYGMIPNFPFASYEFSPQEIINHFYNIPTIDTSKGYYVAQAIDFIQKSGVPFRCFCPYFGIINKKSTTVHDVGVRYHQCPKEQRMCVDKRFSFVQYEMILHEDKPLCYQGKHDHLSLKQGEELVVRLLLKNIPVLTEIAVGHYFNSIKSWNIYRQEDEKTWQPSCGDRPLYDNLIAEKAEARKRKWEEQGTVSPESSYWSRPYNEVICHALTAVGCGAQRGEIFFVYNNTYGEGWSVKGHARVLRNNESQPFNRFYFLTLR